MHQGNYVRRRYGVALQLIEGTIRRSQNRRGMGYYKQYACKQTQERNTRSACQAEGSEIQASHSIRTPRLSGSFAIQVFRNAYGRISSAGCTSCLDQPQDQLDYGPHDSGARSQRHPLQHQSIYDVNLTSPRHGSNLLCSHAKDRQGEVCYLREHSLQEILHIT
jgi:hypothetical protein